MKKEIFYKFHDQTKIRRKWRTNGGKNESMSESNYKVYTRLNKILLPKSKFPVKTFLQTLSSIRSSHNFKNNITLEQISFLFNNSIGFSLKENTKPPHPSAGAKYPLEAYVFSQKSALPKGLYHYNKKGQFLEVLPMIKPFSSKLVINQSWILKAGIIIIITAQFSRTTYKYGDRGYRHILAESGHISQNIYLSCSYLDLNCCSIGGFVDDAVNEFLDINKLDESVLYLVAVG